MQSAHITETKKNKNFVPASVAARRVGYSVDYVSRLAREEKISARREGRQWFVDVDSVKLFALAAEARKRQRQEELKETRRHELIALKRDLQSKSLADHTASTTQIAAGQAAVVALALALVLTLTWNVYDARLDMRALSIGAFDIGEMIQSLFASSYQETSQAVPVTEKRPAVPGVMILDDTTSREEVAAIANTFSDDVTIEFDGSQSGVITPVFTPEEATESYRFLLVPVNAVDQ